MKAGKSARACKSARVCKSARAIRKLQGLSVRIHIKTYINRTKRGLAGAKVYIKTGDGQVINGIVERVIGGYFSVLPTSSIDSSLLGRKVIFQ